MIEFAYQVEDGKVVAVYPRCPKHNFYFKGKPPIVSGCKDCWLVYHFTQIALSQGDKKTNLDTLEALIHHMVELAERGEWDFMPNLNPEISIEHDVSDEDVAAELRKGRFDS